MGCQDLFKFHPPQRYLICTDGLPFDLPCFVSSIFCVQERLLELSHADLVLSELKLDSKCLALEGSQIKPWLFPAEEFRFRFLSDIFLFAMFSGSFLFADPDLVRGTKTSIESTWMSDFGRFGHSLGCQTPQQVLAKNEGTFRKTKWKSSGLVDGRISQVIAMNLRLEEDLFVNLSKLFDLKRTSQCSTVTLQRVPYFNRCLTSIGGRSRTAMATSTLDLTGPL